MKYKFFLFSVFPGEKRFQGTYNALSTVLSIVVAPHPHSQVHSLISVLKKFLIRVERKAQYWKKRLTEDRIYWQ